MDGLTEAKRLLSLGYSVVPVKPRGKSPSVDWVDYQTRLPTESELTEWWSKTPSANLAIITGRLSGVVVVDVDDADKLDELLAMNPTDLVVRTARGFHLYYKHPANGTTIHNRVNAKDGVDVRADGGIVIVPPSIHESGAVYEYVSQGAPGIIPDWLLKPEIAEDQTVSSWIAAAMSGVAEGVRDTTAAKLAGYYFSKGIPLDIATETLIIWNFNNRPPLPNSRIRRTAASVYTTAKRRAKPAPRVAVKGPEKVALTVGEDGVISVTGNTDTPYIVDQYDDSGDAERQLSMVTLDAYNRQYGEVVEEWLIDGWIPENSITMMVAPPGSYKTWIAVDMVVSVAMGARFMGRHGVKQGTVSVFQQEDDHRLLSQRFGLLTKQRKWGDKPIVEPTPSGGIRLRPYPVKLPIHLHRERALNLLDKTALRWLETYIKTVRPSLVYIDPLYTTGSTDDYFAKTAKRISVLKAMRDVYGVSFLLVHHTKKKAEEESDSEISRESLWGSQFLNAALETGIQIRRVPGQKGLVSVLRHHKNQEDSGVAMLSFDINTIERPHYYHVDEETGVIPVQREEANKKTNGGKAKTADDVILDYLVEKGPTTSKVLTETLSYSRSTINRQLKALHNTGAITKTEDGIYSVVEGGMII